jgi:Ca2+-binding EF-hand superfamily protein
MKHNWITTIITAGLLGSGMVLADDNDKPSDRGPGKGGPNREEMRKKILEKFDKDGDGKLSEAEQAEAREAGKKRAEEFFAKLDKNGDGKISQDEAPEEMWQNLSKADKDGDGAVGKEELAAARAARGGGKGGPGKGDPGKGGLGKGGPGKGDPGKGGPGKNGDSGGKGNPLEEFDRNADGKLSQDEVPGEIWARMSKADKDGDGLVSGEELKQAHGNRQGADPNKPGKPKDSDS